MSDFNPDCVLIPLSKNGKHAGKYTAIVSPEDADLAEYTWTARVLSYTAYAKRNVNKTDTYLHRSVLERTLGRLLNSTEMVDHINGNGLDNRRENLRLATHRENMMNRLVRGEIPYRGVNFDKNANRYRARICIDGKQQHIGLYDTQEEAYAAYCKVAKETFGEFVNLD